jgi:hypothetical protein
MVKKRNLFSQITDSRFYEGEPIQTWYVTDNITMTNSSQSYTTTVDYEGEIDTSSTRYGPRGIEYYTYTTTTNGNVTATVHPYEYVSTTSQKDVEVVKNTSVSDSYSLAMENSLSYSFSESDYLYYEVGRVADTVYQDVTLVSNLEKAHEVTASMWEIVSVYNYYENEPTVEPLDNYKSTKIDSSNLVNNTIRLYLFDGGVSQLPAPTAWYKSCTFCVAITYKSYENNTTSKLFSLSYSNVWFPPSQALSKSKTWTFGGSSNYPYLTYYSKSTSWNTLTTVTNTYEVPAQTTSSWVEPRQVSSLV